MVKNSYLCPHKDLDKIDIDKILDDLKTESSLYNYSSMADGRTDKSVETFYDSKDKTLLNNGGFCRLVSYRKDINSDKSYFPGLNSTSYSKYTKYYLDYKSDKGSKTNRCEINSANIEKDITEEDIKKLLNLPFEVEKVIEITSYDNHYYLQYVDNQLKLERIGAHVDLVYSNVSIDAIEEVPVYEDIAIFSLQDVSNKKYNSEVVEQLKGKIKDAYVGYDEVMQDIGLTPSTENKYQLICDYLNIKNIYNSNT